MAWPCIICNSPDNITNNYSDIILHYYHLPYYISIPPSHILYHTHLHYSMVFITHISPSCTQPSPATISRTSITSPTHLKKKRNTVYQQASASTSHILFATLSIDTRTRLTAQTSLVVMFISCMTCLCSVSLCKDFMVCGFMA